MAEIWWRAVAAALVLVACAFPATVECRIRNYKFNVRSFHKNDVVWMFSVVLLINNLVVMANATKLCESKPIVTVNGRFPGPTLVAREDDTVTVKVVNHVKYNVSIHWHGVRQLRTGWADGPAYITQCPIQPGGTYVYKFTLTGQRGTLWWHAHVLWLRATVHGAIVILPKLGVPYPFPKPNKEVVVVLGTVYRSFGILMWCLFQFWLKKLINGEWWKSDTEAVINQAQKLGGAPNTYMLRIVNAALNEELFVRIANHKFTVVEVDAVYVKPFTTDTILIAPGQTTNAIITTTQKAGKYLVAVSPFMDAPIAVDNRTTTASLRYSGILTSSNTKLVAPPPQNSTPVANTFMNSLRSLNSATYPAKVPLTINHSLFFTIGLGINPCATCVNGSSVVADINNITFVMPTTALLQAHYFNISGVFTDDFPSKPSMPYNYTGPQPTNLATNKGTKLYRLPYNSTVQLVLQDTGMIAAESHPIHLHGFNFFVVGRGIGNFNPNKDPKSFNLVDPVERNTVGVPTGGWTAIRFKADNPGVWFMHCHLEVHTTWGLKMAFVVDNGEGLNESVIPPPADLPKC
ncbi:Cupredoxin [Cynara cardunculus var. scolymus]|uniref:Cupredoxin n=1 Tax=Cynara cardunculus var. scolymus TaxID=59895 RepID=A0A103YMP5_CYNCS|nr:Cupredoxin [Cynara cardunculus var. scolymus]